MMASSWPMCLRNYHQHKLTNLINYNTFACMYANYTSFCYMIKSDHVVTYGHKTMIAQLGNCRAEAIANVFAMIFENRQQYNDITNDLT